MENNNTEEKFIEPLRDYVLKTLWILGNRDIQNYLKRIIKHITNIDISNYELTNVELGKESYYSIANKLDLLLIEKDSRNLLDIEVNKEYSVTTINKNNSYLMKISGETYAGLQKKEIYKDDIVTCQVNLNGYLYKYNPKYEILNSQFKDQYGNVRLNVQIFDCFLPAFKNLCYNEDEKAEYLAMLVCTSYEEMAKYADKNKERLAVMEELKRLGRDNVFVDLYDKELYREALSFEKEERAEQRGLERGISQGISQKEREDAINLHKNGASNELIISSLNISEEKLNDYLKNA